ncbi:MAG TPA: SIMPL domain-containing protein [Burkholderiales bacterium]|nr:SIMPL domain-containing protein [Burkholderiales bacterium]
MRRGTLRIMALALLLACAAAAADDAKKEHDPQHDLVSLQAEASREVDNDQALAVLTAEARGDNPAALAEQVNARMAAALKAVKAVPAVRARSGGYRTNPTYSKGRVESWVVSQELRLESSDLPALAKLVGELQQSLLVQGMQLRLSPALRRSTEEALMAEAIAAFQARAELVRKAMKASRYGVRTMNIGTSGGLVVPLSQGLRGASLSAAPVALEAGTSTVQVSVSGTIQLEP